MKIEEKKACLSYAFDGSVCFIGFVLAISVEKGWAKRQEVWGKLSYVGLAF
ncbi:MAG: hypothetical protein RMK94_12110 [Armatimonadota bacterium]|nr:hypothetical protein [Armatimonadota bacterium]